MTEARRLSTLLERELRARNVSEQIAGDAGVELSDAIARCRTRWPEISLAPEQFVAHFAACFAGQADQEVQLGDLRLEDLFLASACLAQDPQAISAFERDCLGKADPALRRLNVPDWIRKETKQILRNRLLVGDSENPPKLVDFRGRGDLCSWVRVSAVRLALELNRQGKRHSPIDDGARFATGLGDAEVEYMEELYREPFHEAFREALASLSSSDRNLLRYYYIERLTVEEIGSIYRIHKSSATRRLAKARSHLLRATKEGLAARLNVNGSTAASIVRLLRSRLEISLRGLDSRRSG